MFGHWYRDEVAFATLGLPNNYVVRRSLSGAPLSPQIANLRGPRKKMTRSETTTLWAAIPSIPTLEAYSAESEGRKREK